MARYDRGFLVPYLEDICSLHLTKKKLLEMIRSSYIEVERIKRTALNRVEEPQLEEYRNNDADAVLGEGIGCLVGICGFGGIATFIMAPMMGNGGAENLMIPFAFAVAAILLVVLKGKSIDTENKEIQERNDEKEADYALGQLAALTIAEPQIKAIQERIHFLENEVKRVDGLLEQAYSVNVIPRWYRDLYPAVYLYDWFSNSRADDLDIALNTLVLEQIKDRLDTIIRNQGEMIINQRMMIANQRTAMAQADRHHAEQMRKLNEICASNEERNMYLSMIEANTAANAYFSAANYLKH